ncbi:hypothetical protein GCM10009117_23970 [Gangjinia marincola]|uniref:PKD domain-containing protein n=1 Tax=Gangjinia marincola TaxID=578463 RepID=A0ABN1MJG6_9FLAO
MKQISKIWALQITLGALLLNSCEQSQVEVAAISAEEVAVEAKANQISDQSVDIVDQFVQEEENKQAGKSIINSFFNPCVSATISNDTNVTSIELDFGDGCTLENGHVAAGQIFITVMTESQVSREINYTYQDFSLSGNLIEGGGKIIRVKENANANPQSTFTADVAIQLEDSGVLVNRSIAKTREWIAGVGTGTWTDNVYLVTGSWTSQTSNGFSKSAEVTQELTRRLDCPIFVSGVVSLARNNRSGELNYGEGECDSLATLTVNGNDYTIYID